jgi:5'(3')-deoxyribonucleotidase
MRTSKRKRWLFLDMDGVLADMDKKWIELFGMRLQDFPSRQIGWAAANGHPDMYRHLDKMIDADVLVDGVFELSEQYDFEVGTLTAIPSVGKIPLAEQHKREWIVEMFPQYPQLIENFNIGPHAKDKQNHAQPGFILIDDSTLNIPQWNNKGGFGILHSSAHNSLQVLRNYLKSSADF